MSRRGDYIELRQALKDYLRDAGITLQDLLDVMDEGKGGILEALRKRIHLTEEEGKALEHRLTSKELNLLLFVVQAFYILNASGTYKGRVLYPEREDVVLGDKVSSQGCKMILRALGIHTNWLYI